MTYSKKILYDKSGNECQIAYAGSEYINLLVTKTWMFTKYDEYKLIKRSQIGVDYFVDNPKYSQATIQKYKQKEVQDIINYLSGVKIGDEKFELDIEQAVAITTDSKHTLVSARAGSGKTRVIIATTLALLELQKVPSESILILSFNKNVAAEIFRRLNSVKYNERTERKEINITKTFHALAYDLINQRGIIEGSKRSKFINDIINDIKSSRSDFSYKVYNMFRTEYFRVDKMNFKDEKSYYNYIKNSQYITLNGDYVKSRGEKWIADYLFEHGITYIYEKEFYPSQIKGTDFLGTEDGAGSACSISR